jgi:methyl-accepting chemotaxis protein
MGRTQEGGATVERAAKAVASIAEGVGRVKGLIEDVSVASDQQAQGIAQVSRAIGEMEQVTQRTAATAEESAAIGAELTAHAASSIDFVQQLDRLAGRSTRVRTAAGPGTAAAPDARPASHHRELRPTGTGAL